MGTRKSNPFHGFLNGLIPVCLQCVPLKLFRGQMKLIVKTELSTQTFAQTPKVMSYILQQKHHTYIKYDVNRLANAWVLNSWQAYQLNGYLAKLDQKCHQKVPSRACSVFG